MIKKILIFIFLFLNIINCNCSKKTESLSDLEKMTIFEYMQRPDEHLNIAIAALILSKDIFPDIKFSKYMFAIDSIAEASLHYSKGSRNTNLRIAAINTALYKEFGLKFDTDDFNGRNHQNHFLSSVLDRRKGVCTGMPLVYMVVAERLGYPIFGVEAPSHVFCRYAEKKGDGKIYYTNIEATGGGGSSPDVVYIDELKIPKGAFKAGVYMRTLTKREYIGSLLHNNGAYYMTMRDFDKALPYLKESVRWNPRNSSTHLLLSQCYHKLHFIYGILSENKEFYNNYKIEEAMAYRLGLAPPCPENYWEEFLTKDKQLKNKNLVTRKDENGVIYTEDVSSAEKVKQLEVKYRDYFN